MPIATALHKSFGDVCAVRDLSLQAHTGRVLGLMGPNGAGKTTLVRMLSGALRPDAGQINICGYNILHQRAQAQACIGYLPEGAPIYQDMSVRDFLRFVGQARRMGSAAIAQAIDWVAQALHLLPVMDWRIDSLSKGFRRRAALAAAVLANPPVWILDEPTDGLDPNQKAVVREFIRHAALHKTIVLSTHLPDEIAALCHDVAVLRRGALAAYGTPLALAQTYALHHTGSLSERIEHAFATLTQDTPEFNR